MQQYNVKYLEAVKNEAQELEGNCLKSSMFACKYDSIEAKQAQKNG